MKKFITLSLLVACLNLQADTVSKLCEQKMQQGEESLHTIYMAVNEEDLEILDTQIPYFMQVSKDAMKYCPESVRDDIVKIRTNIKNEYIKIQKLEEN
jgi:hypothetical protein